MERGAAPARLSPQFLIELYRTYGDDLKSLQAFDAQAADLGFSYHREQRKILYMMVRHFAPEVIVEFSPKWALSTVHSALALEHNGGGRILSFELSPKRAMRAWRNVRRNGLAHRVELFCGDVREELPRVLRQLRADGTGIEFLFVDSDHGAEFARWYLQAVFPYVRRNGVIHIDDVQNDPRNPLTSVAFDPSGEEREVRAFLLANADKYDWVSLTDCVRDPEYLDAVKRFGGGDLSLDRRAKPHTAAAQVGYQWNASLWAIKKAEQEAADVRDIEFRPLRFRPLKALRYRVRRGAFQLLRRMERRRRR